jgi:ElaB/YqjD/DUF883 family membrane-anchored ribosome-binding protein
MDWRHRRFHNGEPSGDGGSLMETKKRRRAELDELAAELKGTAAGAAGRADPFDAADEPNTGEGADAHDYRATLRDLERKLSEAAEDAEHIVVAHPLVAVAAAFLLGLMIGRMGGRS